MTNFKVEKLVYAKAYQDKNGTWYMELKYEYEDESGYKTTSSYFFLFLK